MSSAASITVRVPLAVRRRGGRKVVITPEGGSSPSAVPTRTRADPALVKTLARAHRWKRLLENGRFGSLAELASAEKIGCWHRTSSRRSWTDGKRGHLH